MLPGLKYGLIAAVGMIAWTLAEYATGLHTTRLALAQYTSWGTEFVLVLALWRLLHDRVHAPDRYWLPAWQGILHGLLASLVATMGLYVFLMVYLRFINPEYPYHFLDWQVAQLRSLGRPEEDIRQMARGFLWSMSPVGLPITLLLMYLLTGLVASPILTLWLNWRRKETVHAG